MARGGSRPGAGRKRSPEGEAKALKNALISAVADEVFKTINKVETWIAVLTAGDAKTKLDALKYLEDRQHGKPAQSVNLTSKEPLEVTVHWADKPEWVKGKQS